MVVHALYDKAQIQNQLQGTNKSQKYSHCSLLDRKLKLLLIGAEFIKKVS
jgi:hypothetical protein